MIHIFSLVVSRVTLDTNRGEHKLNENKNTCYTQMNIPLCQLKSILSEFPFIQYLMY